MNFIARVSRRLHAFACRWWGVDEQAMVSINPRPDLARLGTVCGWVVPVSLLRPETVCYCVGAGEDISLDVALARDLRCEVHTFDPTPRAITHVESLQRELPPNLAFHPWGVWEQDQKVRFYAPKNPSHVSHSIVNLQASDQFFEADCKKLKTIMEELGHRSLGLLKLDVEGAEYRVIESMVADGVRPAVLAVEFDEIHTPLDSGARARIRRTAERLLAVGYSLVSVDGQNYTFMHGPTPFA